MSVCIFTYMCVFSIRTLALILPKKYQEYINKQAEIKCVIQDHIGSI